GECLAESVTNMNAQYPWRCALGHEFTMSGKDVKRRHWCTRCFGRLPDEIERLQKIAREHAGELLSKKYTNAYTTLHWRCARRHKWWAVPSSIVQGTWCWECGHAGGKSTARR